MRVAVLARVTLQEMVLAPTMLIGIAVATWFAPVIGFTECLLLDLPIAIIGGSYAGGIVGHLIYQALSFWTNPR